MLRYLKNGSKQFKRKFLFFSIIPQRNRKAGTIVYKNYI